MKEKWYRKNLIKGVLILLEHVFLLLAVLCGVFLIDQYNKGNMPADVRKQIYTATEGFSDKLYEMSTDILRNFSGEELLTDTNKDGTRRMIDLEEVYRGEEYTFKNNSGLAYYLDDLKQWDANNENAGSSRAIVVCRKTDGTYFYYYVDEFLSLLDKGNLAFSWEDGMEETESVDYNVRDYLQYSNLQQSRDYGIKGVTDKKGNLIYSSFWNFQEQYYNEKYTPVGADSILDVVNTNKNWNGKLSEAYMALESIFSQVDQARSLSENASQYGEGNTNMTYLYVDQVEKKVYSNKAEYRKYTDYKASLEEIQNSESHLIVQPKLSNSYTTMDTNLQEWQDMVEGLGPVNAGGQYIYAISVDTNFPIGDSLAEYNRNFMEFAELLIPAIVICIVSILLFLAGIIWLTLVAGRRYDSEKLYLSQFDHWFTEIAAGGIFLLWMLPAGFVVSIGATDNPDGMLNVIFMLVTAFESLFLCGMFLIGYLSLVRRIKAKNLWKESLLRWLLHWIKKIWNKFRNLVLETYHHFDSIPRTIALFGGFILFHLLMTIFIASGGILFFLILLAVDGVVLYYYIKRANGHQVISNGLEKITNGEVNYKIPMEPLMEDQRKMADYINRIGEGLDAAIENSLKNERMKTELITNVSHDIKTPLTSIINYIDLLKRENFTDPKVLGYLDVLEKKAQRLKILTEDVVEASKVSTGNITLEMTNLDLVEMVNQVIGEFQEKMDEKHLALVINLPKDPAVIHADGRRMWRVLANVFNNISKYAMEGTRVYVDLMKEEKKVTLSLKNISANPLNISADELTERFIRGDVARSTEGSGLGLSIAKSLTQLQQGDFQIYLDGDLFKIIIVFPKA